MNDLSIGSMAGKCWNRSLLVSIYIVYLFWMTQIWNCGLLEQFPKSFNNDNALISNDWTFNLCRVECNGSLSFASIFLFKTAWMKLKTCHYSLVIRIINCINTNAILKPSNPLYNRHLPSGNAHWMFIELSIFCYSCSINHVFISFSRVPSAIF